MFMHQARREAARMADRYGAPFVVFDRWPGAEPHPALDYGCRYSVRQLSQVRVHEDDHIVEIVEPPVAAAKVSALTAPAMVEATALVLA